MRKTHVFRAQPLNVMTERGMLNALAWRDPFQSATPLALCDVRGMLAFINACDASAVRVARGFAS